MKQKFFLHICLLDAGCRRYAGIMLRVHLNTPWWHFGVALRPKDKFANIGDGGDWISKTRWPKQAA